MSIFVSKLYAINPTNRKQRTPVYNALVDTGSHMSWLPEDALREAGIMPEGKKRFLTAANQRTEREYGYAILSNGDYTTNDEIVFAKPGDMVLLGVRTIEGFNVMVDNVRQRFVPVEPLYTGITLESDVE